MQISCMQPNFTCSLELTEYAYRDECNSISMFDRSRDIQAQGQFRACKLKPFEYKNHRFKIIDLSNSK